MGSLRMQLLLPLALAGALASAAAPLAAQATGAVQGRVTDAATSRPIPDAQVTLVGTGRRAVTDAEGRYTIPGVPAGAAGVQAGKIGYSPATTRVTVAAGATATADLALGASVLALDELVVTATGETRRREVATSLESIGGREIENAPVRNAQEIIAGRAAGVTVLGNSGQPGAGGTIRLRGNNSISQGNNPLIYVDGVRIYSGFTPTNQAGRQGALPLNDIKAEDIDRVEIVKGAAATTLYGTEASGGVIQIFTKRGTGGAPQWSAEVTGGVNQMGHVGPDEDPTGLFINRCRGEGLVQYPDPAKDEAVRFEDPTCPSGGSWLRNGAVQQYSLSVRGGAEALRYFVSGNYSDQEGVIAPGGSRDGGFRGNFGFAPVRGLDLSLNTSYQKRSTRWIPDGNNANGFMLNVARGFNSNFKRPANYDGPDCSTPDITCIVNGDLLTSDNTTRNDHFITGFTVAWVPGDRLSNRLTVGYDYNSTLNESVNPFNFVRTPKGQILSADYDRAFLSLDYAGSFRNSFGGSLASTFSWGGQLFDDRRRFFEIEAFDFSGPGEPTVESAARRTVLNDDRERVINAGLFLQEALSWNDRLFLTLGMRIDGNSAFGENLGLQTYPKASVAYVVSDHASWPSAWWETLKLRAALGESGKAPGAFDAVRTWRPVAGDEGQPAVTPDQVGNPDLGPERTRELEAGFESSMFEGRLGLDVTWFNTVTDDALVPVTYPPSQGFLDTQLENVGRIRNRGLEMSVNAGLVRTPAVEWRARLNYSGIESEVEDLGGQEVLIGSRNYAIEGHPLPSFFGRKLRNPDRFEEPSVAEDTLIGPSFPDRIIGVGSNLTLFGSLTVDVLGEFQRGGYLANWIGYQNSLRGVWKPCQETQAKLRRAAAGDAGALSDVTALQRAKCAIDRTRQDADFWTQSSDFFKLRNVSVTYDVPQRWMPGGRSASFTLAGRNLFTSTDYDGLDPESTDRRDDPFGRREYYQLPSFRTLQASLRVSF